MAAKIKPVQPTEIKDYRIAQEAIAQVRKPIPKSVYKRLDQEVESLKRLLKK